MDTRLGWPAFDEAAFHGIAGEVVRTIAPHSEADPVAVLLDFLVSAGNAIGPNPYLRAGSNRQTTKLFGLIVGDTSKARKGTSRNDVRQVMELADARWSEHHQISGLASGEGLITAVANMKDPADEFADAPDKRALVFEPEFGRVLTAGNREGSTLSAIMRDAYDRGRMELRTRRDPLIVADSFVSIIGHITVPELRLRLGASDLTNGYANRFLMVCARRSKRLPNGEGVPEDECMRLAQRVGLAIDQARHLGHVAMNDAAQALYSDIYMEADERADDPLTARMEGHVQRLALVYAVLDGKTAVDVVHVRAALALWRYCEASMRFIFGPENDTRVDELRRLILAEEFKGIARRDIYRAMRTKKADLDEHLLYLSRQGVIAEKRTVMGGAPEYRYYGSEYVIGDNVVVLANYNPVVQAVQQ